MRLKQLHGLPVIDPTAARKVGTVTDYQVDAATGLIAALDVNPAEHTGSSERILGDRIRRVGRHAVVLTGTGGSSPNLPADLNQQWLDASSLVGLEVMGDDGDRIGKLADATFDQDSLEIGHYLLRSTSFWEELTGRRSRIQPSEVHSCSRELMIVRSGTLAKEVSDEPKPSSDDEALGVPLKVEDRVPAPTSTSTKVEDGQPITAKR
ncbi:MAG TPA: PRC-barrel domain-containing protein [Chloroflexota bacterium]|jgi:sporulation protein YlmC with PRC-barrel domain|nr:PRC-barrel domain-containing protein [Chloroflexota bacterium]